MAVEDILSDYLIAPDPKAVRLTRAVMGHDHDGQPVEISVVEERPLTIFLNGQEIVTAMTIGDYPDYLALGFLRNQGMLRDDETVTGVDYDEDLETVVVRTDGQTTYEEKLKKKTRTSGCAVGTVFGDMMEGLEGMVLPEISVKTSDLYQLASKINRTPSLYLEAGAIHGTVLCQGARPLVYMEDVGRHNAVDKIAGWMLSEGVRAE
ncbi:MAG: formate dehydrogenase accessory sulfurtransferase FdhD, partial [Pseudomonadota bacterium]